MSAFDDRTNPYVGLRPFFAADSLYFFGREQQTAELLEILHQNRFLGIVGSSGSGKSSLVRAGLIPSLLAGFLAQDRDRWRIVETKPGDTPIGNLAAALLKATGKTVTQQARAELEELIHDEHTDAVVDFLKPLNEENANVFLLVDQFEEIFAFRGDQEDDAVTSDDPKRRKERARRKSEAADFVDLLMKLAERREVPIYVALTMRTDFLGDCDLFYGFPEALNKGRYLVPRMTRPQLRDAIEAPATLMGARVAPRLLDHVLNALGDRFDRLPVLQHALLRTWDAWQKSGSMGAIDLLHFEEMAGGLEGALDQDAENALKGLDVDTTSRIFKRLTDTDLSQRRVRSPARISELVAVAGVDRAAVIGVVRRFEEDHRNFVYRSDDGQPDDQRVDISHESLIRQWDRLRDWVDEERQSRDQFRELVARAGKKPRTMLRDPELQTFVDWRERAKPSAAWATRYSATEGECAMAMGYLDESVKLRVARKAEWEMGRRWREVFLGVVAITGVLYGLGLILGNFTLSLWEAAQSWDGVKAAFVNSETALLQVLRKIVQVGVIPVAAYAFFELGRRLHQKLILPDVLRAVGATGGRESREKREDAVLALKTSYASTLTRAGSYLIDALLYVPVVLVVGWLIVRSPATTITRFGNNILSFLLLAALFVIGWLYMVLQIASPRRGTVGMRASGIFRTDMNGAALSFWKASAWYAARVVSFLSFGLGYAIQPFNSRRQTLHDRIGGTVVLRRPGVAGASGVPVGLRWVRWSAALVYLVVAAGGAMWAYARLSPDPRDVVGVRLNVPPGNAPITVSKGGEKQVRYSLLLAKSIIDSTSVDSVLQRSGGSVKPQIGDPSILEVDSLDRFSGSLSLRGIKTGQTYIQIALLLPNGDTVRSKETATVQVLETTGISAAAYDAFRAKLESDTESDSSLGALLAVVENEHGRVLRESFGLGNDLDALTDGTHRLISTGNAAELLLKRGASARALTVRDTLAAYVQLANAVRSGHSPLLARYTSSLDSLNKTIDGVVLTYGVCRAPCNSEERRDTQFSTGDNIVIRMHYKVITSGRLFVEWRRGEQRMAIREYYADPNPTGYRIWDQKNLSGDGGWEVRVLNKDQEPVMVHSFRAGVGGGDSERKK